MTATASTLVTVAGALTAVVGCYVTYLAYRGYRRNESETMRTLSFGILFIAVVPYAVSTLAAPLLGLTDAQALLGVTMAHALGLVAIYRSFG